MNNDRPMLSVIGVLCLLAVSVGWQSSTAAPSQSRDQAVRVHKVVSGVEEQGSRAPATASRLPIADPGGLLLDVSSADSGPPGLVAPALVVPGLPRSIPLGSTIVASVPARVGFVDVHSAPGSTAPIAWTLDVFDEFGQPRVFRVLEELDGWVRVQVPVRPNEAEGWLPTAGLELDIIRHRMLIDLSDRSVVVWEGDEVVMDTTGAIGRPSSPTPTGSFFIRSVFEWAPDSVYGPWVIPLSAYSESIDEINGGAAVVAIHGTNRPELLGRSVSLGCVRLDNDVISELAAIVPAGTPVEVVP